MGNDQKKPSQSTNQYHPDIVVVSDNKQAQNENDLDVLNKLDFVPLFYPILKSSIDLKEDQYLFEINQENMIKLAELLKNHLYLCAFNVTKDQEAISIEIKHVSFVIDMLMQNFLDKQKRYAKYCEQFKTVHDLSASLKKIKRNMDEIIPMMNEINDLLPDNERLEDFNF